MKWTMSSLLKCWLVVGVALNTFCQWASIIYQFTKFTIQLMLLLCGIIQLTMNYCDTYAVESRPNSRCSTVLWLLATDIRLLCTSIELK